MGFELGQTYSEYEFLDVVKRSRSIIAYRVRNLAVARLELLQVLPQTAQDDGEQVERFLRETRVRANLRHPNIAVFYSASPLEGQWVMTTELVEGPPLAERLQLGPLHWPQAVGLAIQALSALSCAHENSIIHRDISAESIVVTPDGTLKLSNFALAKTTNGPQLTQAGAIIGNLRYISPEQIRGGELDARSDIYSLGIVLYEMLCGAPPFDTRSQFELMLAHVNKAPLPPSIVNPGVPAELDNIVLKALAKDPGERYQSAAEFAEALLAVGLGGSEAAVEGAAAADTPPPEPAAKPAIEAIAEPAAAAVSEMYPEPLAPEPVAEAPAEPVAAQFQPEPVAEPEAFLPVAEPEPAIEPAMPAAPEPGPESIAESAIEPAGTPFEPAPEPVDSCILPMMPPTPEPSPEPRPFETVPEPPIANMEQAAAEDPV